MPYKDRNKRRQFDKEYKRRRRHAAKAVSTLEQPRMIKAYICPRVPNLRLPGGIIFRNAIFVTDNHRIQAIIENDSAYRTYIFAWRLEP